MPSPFGLPFRSFSTGGRNRTCELLFNREAHEPAHATPVRMSISVGAAGFEPAFSRSRTGRIRQAFPRPESSNQVPSGSRTRTSAMARRQAAATSWARSPTPDCQRIREHRVGLEPTSPHYGCGVLAAGRPVQEPFGTRGTRALTSPFRGRARFPHVSIPSIESAREESNLRLSGYQPLVLPLNHEPVGRSTSPSAPGESNPSSLTYKVSALTVELGAVGDPTIARQSTPFDVTRGAD